MNINFNFKSNNKHLFINTDEKKLYKTKKCVYTANIGLYDHINDPTIMKQPDWDYICFTDDENFESTFWKVVYVKKPNNLTNVQFARDIKINFYKYLPEYELTMWIDSNIIINANNLNDMFIKVLSNSKFIVSVHPQRHCIYEEAHVIVKTKKANRQDVLNQIKQYELEGYPKNNGLAETNLLLRYSTKENIEFCKRWFNEILKYTHRDQLSFNYTLWKYPINVTYIKSPIVFSDSFQIITHNSNSNHIAVIMCTWNRIERLSTTIKMLEKQFYQHFDFYIWNNNYKEKDKINDIIVGSSINIAVYHSEENVKGFGRFYYAKEIYKDYPVILFIDDDLDFNNTFVYDFFSAWKMNTVYGWWAWKIINNEYFNRIRANNFETANYIGTAAMVLDSEIFKCDILYNCPEKYKDVEDIWINYVANHILKWNLLGLNVNARLHKDDKDMSEVEPEYMNNKKQSFLNYLIKTGWKL